jgi:hypothetical protein
VNMASPATPKAGDRADAVDAAAFAAVELI